jgi:hypothetical protein
VNDLTCSIIRKIPPFFCQAKNEEPLGNEQENPGETLIGEESSWGFKEV